MKRAELVRLLARVDLFEGLGDATLEALAEAANPRTFKRQGVIFHEGDEADAFYALAEGRVKAFVTSDRGEQMVLATLEPPETFGEVALFDAGRRSATIECLTPVTAIAFARSRMRELARSEPLIADVLFQHAGALLRRLTGQAADLVFLDLEGRVAKKLSTLGEERGEHVDNGIALDLGVTQGDLAAMVGGSRQSVNQILHALEGRGFLQATGRRIVILDPERLRRRASL